MAGCVCRKPGPGTARLGAGMHRRRVQDGMPGRRSFTMKDLIAFYRTRDQAERVKDELISAGFDRDDITLYDRGGKHEANLWEDIKSAFGFADEDDQRIYAEAARRGAVAV